MHMIYISYFKTDFILKAFWMLLNVRLNTKEILLGCLSLEPIKVQAIPDNNILQNWLCLKEERRFTVLFLFSALLIAISFGVSQVIFSYNIELKVCFI